MKKIGSGGYSNVYLVKDPISDNIYALKRMFTYDTKDRERAQRELDIYQKLVDNPYIINLYDYDIIEHKDGSVEFNFLLQYYERGSLFDYIEGLKNEYMPEEKILGIFLKICYGIKSLHDLDPPMTHRDIKPQNILLGNDDSVVLIDFASVTEAKPDIEFDHTTLEYKEQQMDALETSTPSYRPPELFDLGGVFSDQLIDERVDIWSLGCLLYCMAYHQNPFLKAVARGGDLKLAVINGNYDIPEGSPYSEEFNNLFPLMINTKPEERLFIHEIISKLEQLTSKN